ncbi:MAG: carboxypeptidase-like regulatory domain-containing protein [Elusimicrobiota bacterium]|nr:carboxypeptidase-like regulatory domain-containing protein [Elusimicrobiota bacterium]
MKVTLCLCAKYFARNILPALVAVGLLHGNIFAAELVGTTKKVQRNAAAMGGKRSSGATKALSSMSGQGTISMSAGTSKKIRRGHQAIRYYPATILNLGARTGTLHGEASLTWTAPGADGMAGTASGYRIAYSTAGPITSEIGFDAAAVYSQSFVPLTAGATESRLLSGLPYGATVYFAVKGIEPAGNRGYVSNSTAAYVLGPVSIAGTVDYYGTQGGKIMVAVFDSTRIFTTANLLSATQLVRAGAYSVTGIPPGTTFYAAGFVDMNQSLQFESGEDYGFYGGATPVPFNLTSGGSAAGINFSVLVASTAHLGTISGTILYTGAQSGSLRIEVFNNQAFSGQPVAAISTNSAGAYSFLVPGDVAYFMRAFVDQNANIAFDTGEAAGLYGPLNQGAESIFVPKQGTAPGKNVTIYDPGCSAAGCSGQGTASASLSVSTAGSLNDFNIRFIVGPSGMQVGGLAGFGVPAGWGAAQNIALTVTSTNTRTVALDASGQFSATARVTAGSLNPGDTVQFTISQLPAPCQARTSIFTVTAAQKTGAAALPLASGSPAISVQPGGAVTLAFSPLSLTLTQFTTSQALLLSGKDLCGGFAAVSSSTDVIVSGRVYNFSTGLFAPAADLQLAASPADGFSTPVTVTFAAGQSSATLFAAAFSTGSKHIQAEYLLTGTTRYAYCAVNVLQGDPFSSVNLSSGAFITSRASMTITPDGDGVGDMSFINFNLADPALSWTVQIASSPLDAGGTALWQSRGSGSALPGRVAWDGRVNLGADAGRTVPSGGYYVLISAGGASTDTLRISVLVNQVSGQVTDPGITPAVPVPDVKVQAFGPVAAQALTDSAGRYLMSGLSAGTYTFAFSKGQYLSVSTRTVVASTSTILNIPLSRAPVLEVTPTLQAGATQPYEQWGELVVYNAGWARNFQQPIRLPAGTTTFDDGGQWNSSLQQFVTRTRFSFEVTLDTYTIDARLAGYIPVSSAAYVGPAGLGLTLPQLYRRVNLSGLISLSTATNPAPNPGGLTVSVLALSSGIAKGSTLASLPAGTTSVMYLITGMEPGSYTLRASAPGFESVSSGPVTVGANNVSVDLPSFKEGGLIVGTVTVTGNTAGFTALAGSTCPVSIGITAWSQQTAAQSRTTVYLAYAATASSAQYVITGLKPGATYQIFADISFNADAAFQSAGGFPKTVFISTQNQTASLNFSFEKASGAVAGLMLLPPVEETGSAPDFTLAGLKWRILKSDDPLRVGRIYEVLSSTGLPEFRCGGTTPSTGTAPGCTAGISSATFRLSGFRTETLELAMFYSPTGRSKVVTVAAVNGSTIPTTLDLRGDTYSISGKIINQISDPLFNTNALISQNAPFYAPAGYPANVSSTTARVEAIRRQFGELQTQVSTSVFDAANTRIGFLAPSGTFTITGIQNGVYLLRTLPLRAGTTGPILVPSKEQLVTVANAGRAGADFTLSDGFSVSGRVYLDQGLSDARSLRLALRNRRGEIVETADLLLGNPGAGVVASSADYLFERVPSAGFYTLEAEDLGTPVKYIARPLSFPDRTTSPDGLQGEVSGMELLLKRAGAITGKLRDANSDSLITETNATLLAPNFKIYAIANPWREGGYIVAGSSVSGRPIEADGTFRIEPLAPGVAYDIHLEQESWDMAFLNAGSQNYAPAVIAGMTLSPGQVKDIGIVDLNQGQSIRGTVSGSAGVRLPNITMSAVPALVENPASVNTQTSSDGSYTLWVSSFISRYFDVTASARADNLQEAEGAVLYGKKTLRVDLQKSAAVDFVLEPLLGKVTGQVLTDDQGALSCPFGDQKGYPAAAVYLQRTGTIPQLNPLGDILAMTETDGRFEIPGLSTGAYSLNAVSLGYLVHASSVSVTTGTISAGNITLVRGASVLGSIRKADPASPTGYSCPNDQEVAGIAAADDYFTQYLIGTVEKNTIAHTVCSYEIPGFRTGLDYQIALLGASGDDIVFPNEGAVSFEAMESTASKTVNLTYRVPVPECLPTFKYLGNNQIQLKFRCNKALRNETGPDNDLSYILQQTTYTSAGAGLSSPDGTGEFLGSDKKLLQGRRNLTAVYRPADTEEKFSVRLRAYTAALDPSTGNNYEFNQVYDFYTAVDASKSKKMNNMQGGKLDMESEDDDDGVENTSLEIPPGTFVEDGETDANPDTSVEVGVNKGKTKEQAKAKALSLSSAAGPADDRLKNPGAFPPNMASAILALKAGRVKGFEPQAGGRQSVVTPFSAFYDIFLPAGIKRELKNKARLTLSYDASLSTSASLTNLNIWYFNYATMRFELEEDSKQIDTTNNTVSALVDHFSTFVVLASTPLYTSTSSFTGAGIEVFNFPNPFNLETKTRTLNVNAGGGNYSAGTAQVTTRGTIIRVGVPRGISGQGKIRIYNLAGEVVREYDCGYLDGAAGVSGAGTYYYFEWDGRNGAGREVASDVYFGEIKIGGQKKFWKMAVVKDPKYR